MSQTIKNGTASGSATLFQGIDPIHRQQTLNRVGVICMIANWLYDDLEDLQGVATPDA